MATIPYYSTAELTYAIAQREASQLRRIGLLSPIVKPEASVQSDPLATVESAVVQCRK